MVGLAKWERKGLWPLQELGSIPAPHPIKKERNINMPIHEYRCEDCGHVFEDITMRMDEAKHSTECPKCKKLNKTNIAKKIVSSGTVFTIHGYNSSNGYAGHMR